MSFNWLKVWLYNVEFHAEIKIISFACHTGRWDGIRWNSVNTIIPFVFGRDPPAQPLSSWNHFNANRCAGVAILVPRHGAVVHCNCIISGENCTPHFNHLTSKCKVYASIYGCKSCVRQLDGNVQICEAWLFVLSGQLWPFWFNCIFFFVLICWFS